MTSTPRDTGAWIRRFHPSDAPVRLVCFPHAGGAATYYHPMSMRMSAEMEVLAVQYPGRQDRRTEPCVGDMSKLADLVVEEIRPWTDRPLAFFGHSMGAVLGYEVARRLERDGVRLLTFFASGRRAPSCVRAEDVHLRDDAGLITEVKKLNGTDDRLLDEPEVVEMLLPALRSDYQAVETYRYEPGPALGCPVVVLTGDRDPQVTAEEARAWREHTDGSFDLRTYPGGHFYLNAHAPSVMETVAAQLRDVRAAAHRAGEA
ncbi:thioesterase II family protein [Streptomyces sp. SP18CS02]|uniref:thioesterase II family protein n=1 Tax=Streptomyces sp. SP18CS02 TaxID=3002531 RepID=UPI002E7685C7|nr:alpha/beta fold hydrolase [Streptomyces sp. SP18CS02]MEE1753767.1 alpha/beta fold hydrolase [Streptomyces sp. SP18CS02]